MSKRNGQMPSALKHGIYSGLTLLPGEDPAAYEKLHNELIAEYNPDGPFERDIVAEIARLIWRKQNLSTYGLATRAKSQYSSIYSVLAPPSIAFDLPMFEADKRSPEELRALRKEADEKAKSDLGAALELVEMGVVVTTDYLLKELSIIERLNSLIERCLKQLLYARGVKSMSSASAATASQSRLKRIA
jgi:hypothetical protein